eukprot:1687321-Rhodomonas_salina.3
MSKYYDDSLRFVPCVTTRSASAQPVHTSAKSMSVRAYYIISSQCAGASLQDSGAVNKDVYWVGSLSVANTQRMRLICVNKVDPAASTQRFDALVMSFVEALVVDHERGHAILVALPLPLSLQK